VRHPLLVRARTAVYPWVAVGGLLSAWILSLLLGGGQGVDVTGEAVAPDFLTFYSAAQAVADDPSIDLYHLDSLDSRQRGLVPAMTAERDGAYLSPPPALLVFAPFARLQLWSALGAWWALNLGAWIAALVLIRRTMTSTPWSLTDLAVGSLWFAPVLIGFLYGQMTGLIAVIMAAVVYLLVTGRETAAGAVLGLLAFKPQLALALAWPLIVRLRWRALLAGGASALAVAAASWLLWPEQWVHAPRAGEYAIHVLTDSGYQAWGIVSIFGFFHLLFGPISSTLVTFLTLTTTLTALAAMAILWRRIPWEPHTDAWRLGLAASLSSGLLLGIHLFSYDLALVLIAFWLVVDTLKVDPRRDPPLDDGPLLVWACLIGALGFAGPYLTLGLQRLIDAAGLPPVTIGFTTLGLAAASVALWREALRRAPPRVPRHDRFDSFWVRRQRRTEPT
jgi:hypothetical protein